MNKQITKCSKSGTLKVCKRSSYSSSHESLWSVCFQVYVFDVGGKTWKSYNWSMVTTVAAFGKYDAELMCYAHSKGARLVLKGRIWAFCLY